MVSSITDLKKKKHLTHSNLRQMHTDNQTKLTTSLTQALLVFHIIRFTHRNI